VQRFFEDGEGGGGLASPYRRRWTPSATRSR